MKSWRDVISIHPAADVFPMLSEDELRRLGEDIQKNGLKESVALWSPRLVGGQPQYLLDGRNRLDAMELVGMSTVAERPIGSGRWWVTISSNGRDAVEYLYGDSTSNPVPDPASYVISKNIHRRHLTKEQQADLIIKALEAGNRCANLARSTTTGGRSGIDFAKMARSMGGSPKGQQGGGGSTKDPVKQAAVEEAAKHGISERTVERAIAKSRGAVIHPSVRVSGLGGDEIVRRVLAFIDRNLADPSFETLEYICKRLAVGLQERAKKAPRKMADPAIEAERNRWFEDKQGVWRERR
jgi:hypothetical protein